MAPKPTGIPEHLPKMDDIRAVVFDVYGTLFISGTGDISIAQEMSNEAALTEALQLAGFSGNLKEAGRQGTTWLLQAIQHAHAVGKTQGRECPEVDIRHEWKNVLAQLQQHALIQGEMTPDTVVRISVEYEYRVNPVWPMPELAETLNSLQKNRLTLGIVSNAQFYTLLLFPAFLKKSYRELGFTPDLCAWSFQALEAKPSLNLFQGIVERLKHDHIAPAETLYVGNDKLNDIWPAAQLGFKTALFAGDQRSLRLRENETRCSALEPDLVITTLSQLIEALVD
jgi:putative hydrolase of the HAD superfamily